MRRTHCACVVARLLRAWCWLVRSDGGAAAGDARGRSVELLAAFDEAWVTYLEQFAAWKLADAATLEVRLVVLGSE